jgi:hypothetical protein
VRIREIKPALGWTKLNTSVVAECWALRDGLLLAFQLGCLLLEVELNAKFVANLVNSPSSSNRSISGLLNDYSLQDVAEQI